MATVKDLAAYVCDKLAGKVLIHRYDAYSTNSVYLKFDYGLGNSLRLSDHTGKAGLNYRFNIITTMKSLGIYPFPGGTGVAFGRRLFHNTSRTRPATRRDREGRGSRHINSGERNTYDH